MSPASDGPPPGVDAPERRERVTMALLALLGAAGAAASIAVGTGSFAEPGLGLFPLIVSASLLGLAIIGLGLSVAGAGDRAGVDPEEVPAPRSGGWRRWRIYCLVLAAVPFGLDPLGYLPSMSIGMIVTLHWGEGVPLAPSAILSVLAVGASFVLFDLVLGVPLPLGRLQLG